MPSTPVHDGDDPVLLIGADEGGDFGELFGQVGAIPGGRNRT